MRHAYDNVPHYRRAFDAAGVAPDDLEVAVGPVEVPLPVKQDLRDNYPFGMFAVPRQKIARVHASSGTTGKPTVVATPRATSILGYRGGAFPSAPPAGGPATGARELRLWPVHRWPGAHYGAERAGCTVVPMSGGQTEKQVQLIREFQPDIIMVTPSYMLNLIEEMMRQAWTPPRLR